MYKVYCENGHCLKLKDDDELEELFQDLQCNECDGYYYDFDEDDFVRLKCPICGYEISCSFEGLKCHLGEECSKCSGSELYLEQSSHYASLDFYYHEYETGDAKKYRKLGRKDYTNLLIHLTSYDKFEKILLEKKIRASETGYFRRKAVCFSEIPPEESIGIREKIGDWGIIFTKKQIIEAGGMPAIYIPQKRLEAFKKKLPSEIQPFVNKISLSGKILNFLHEREWRIDVDIDLSTIKPTGIATIPKHIYPNHNIIDEIYQYKQFDYYPNYK